MQPKGLFKVCSISNSSFPLIYKYNEFVVEKIDNIVMDSENELETE